MTSPARNGIEWLSEPGKYDPRSSDVERWIKNVGAVCGSKGIPDAGRPKFAMKYIQKKIRGQFEEALVVAAQKRPRSSPIQWAEFAEFVRRFDRE